MDSIILKNYNITTSNLADMINYAGCAASSCAVAVDELRGDGLTDNRRVVDALSVVIRTTLFDLVRTLDILTEEAARRESENEALEKIRAAETPEGKAAQVEEAKRVLPHMMEQLVANLRAECSGKEGAA